MLKTLFSKTSLRVKRSFKRAVIRRKLNTAVIYARTEELNARNALHNAHFYKLTASSLRYQLEDLS